MKKNNILKNMIIITLIMTLAVNICYNTDKVMAYTGDDFKNAIEIRNYNKKVNGSLSISENKKYYNFTTKNASKVKLTFNSTIKDDLEIHIYNGSMVEISKTYSAFNVPKKSSSFIWESCIEAGEYYIVVTPVNMGSEGGFNLQVGLKKLIVDEREPNDITEQLQRIDLNKTYTGMISQQDKIDMYSIEVLKAGPIKLDFKLKYKGYLNVKFYKEDNSAGVELDTRYNSLDTNKSTLTYEKDLEIGKYIVIVDAKDDMKTGTYTLSVKGEIPIINMVNPITKKTIAVGKSYTFKPLINPLNYTDKLVYTSTKQSVANVNSKGKIMAHKKGKATIKAQSADGRFAAMCTVTVK